MSGIADLIERLEKLDGPDPYLDEAIWEEVGGWPEPEYRSVNYPKVFGTPLTASLDAATALVERALPGWGWDVASNTEHIKACLNPEFGTPVGRHPHWAAVANTSSKRFHDGATPAIAICLALLRALQQEDRR